MSLCSFCSCIKEKAVFTHRDCTKGKKKFLPPILYRHKKERFTRKNQIFTLTFYTKCIEAKNTSKMCICVYVE